jgi:hypothetical protein
VNLLFISASFEVLVSHLVRLALTDKESDVARELSGRCARNHWLKVFGEMGLIAICIMKL